MQMQIVARGWLTYDMTTSAIALSMVMLSFMAPSVVFSLFGGVIADRMKKKPIMLISQFLNAIATGLLAWIIFTDQITFWHFIYFGLFNGTVLSMSMPRTKHHHPRDRWSQGRRKCDGSLQCYV